MSVGEQNKMQRKIQALAEQMLDCAGAAMKKAERAAKEKDAGEERYHLGEKAAYLRLYQLLKDYHA